MSDDLKIQPAMALPRKLVDNIQPTYSINTRHMINVVQRTSRSTTGSTILFTTPTDRDFFLTSMTVAATCDATADSTNYSGFLFPFNSPATSVLVIEIPKQTTTALSNVHQIKTFDPPIKISRGSAISITQAFTVGTSIVTGSLMGYTTDPQ